MFKLAELFVDIRTNLNPLDQGLGQARSRVNAWSVATNRAISGASLALLGTVAAGGAAAAVGLYKGVQAAASLNESLSKAAAVFGPEAKAITDAAEDMAKKFGSSKQTIVDMATEAGILGQGLGGLANAPAAEFGVKILKMADDLVSFADVAGGVPEAMRSISSGLRGESEPMTRFGVIMQEDQVKAEALRLGLVKLGQTLTAQQKFAARASLLETGLAKAKGDHERTAGSAKNRQREVGGRAANLQTDIGQAVLPVWTEIVNATNRAAQALTGFVSGSKAQLDAWGSWAAGQVRNVLAGVIDLGRAFGDFLGSEAVKGARAWAAWAASAVAAVDSVTFKFTLLGQFGADRIGALKNILEGVGVTLRNFDDVLELTGVNMAEAFTRGGESIAWAAGVAQDFGAYLAGNWQSLATDAMNAVSTAVMNLGKQIKAVLDALARASRGKGFEVKLIPLFGEFEAKSEAFKVRERNLSDFSDQKTQITDRIAAKEAARKSTVITPADMSMATGAGAGDAKALPSAAAGGPFKAEFFGGGQDYHNRIQSAALGAGGKTEEMKMAEKQAKAAEGVTAGLGKLDATMTKLAEKLDRGKGMGTAAYG